MVGDRHVGAVTELFADGQGPAVPLLRLIQPPPVLRDHTELVVDARHTGAVTEFLFDGEGFTAPVLSLLKLPAVPGNNAESMVSARQVGAVAELFLDGEGPAVPVLRLVQPTSGLCGQAELVGDNRDVSAGPVGHGLVLQEGEGAAVALSGLIRLALVLLSSGLLDGGVEPQGLGGLGRCLGWACGDLEDPVGPGVGLRVQAAGVPVRAQRPDDVFGVGPRVVVQGVAEHRAEGPPLPAEQRIGQGSVPGADLVG